MYCSWKWSEYPPILRGKKILAVDVFTLQLQLTIDAKATSAKRHYSKTIWQELRKDATLYQSSTFGMKSTKIYRRSSRYIYALTEDGD